jgi:hypothetical protein
MIGWFVSLILVLVFSVGAWIPGAMDGALTAALQERLGATATARVHVEGDPLLQMPFGHVPVVEARLTGYRVMDVPVKQVTLRLTDVKVQPQEAFFSRRAVLQAPAGAWVAVEIEASALQAYLDRLVAGGAFNHMQAGIALFGRPVTASLRDPVLTLNGGRIGMTGIAEMSPSGARVPVEASAGLEIQDGSRLNLVAPQIKLNGQALPAFLLAGTVERFNPVLDLSTLQLPPGQWRLLALELTPAGATLKAGGEITALPAQ